MILNGCVAHLRSCAVTHIFKLLSEVITHDVFDERLCLIGTVTIRVHVLIAPYVVSAVVSVLQCRFYTVDGNSLNIRVVYQVRKCYITDGTLILLNGLQKRTGVVCLKRGIGSLFLSI